MASSPKPSRRSFLERLRYATSYASPFTGGILGDRPIHPMMEFGLGRMMTRAMTTKAKEPTFLQLSRLQQQVNIGSSPWSTMPEVPPNLRGKIRL